MRLHSALAIAFLPAAALAQDVSGTISGTLDLDDANWTIVDAENQPPSGWRETEAGIRVELHGVADTAPDEEPNVFSIAFTLPDDATQPVARDSSATLRRADGPTVTSNGPNLDLELTNAALEDDRLIVSGDLVTTLTPGEHDELIVDPGPDATTFDGSFQATIERLE